ncbi:hypothetical protein LCGC14_3080730 [marine sediment metagenome]|uniref:SWIM-type domain-containing protein n=1 Tax=marine sediment metagenome TaxID=412755 RepID=A0A0F8Z430_9ZZZZ
MKDKNNPTREETRAALRKINYALRALPNVTEFKIAATKGTDIYYVMRTEAISWTCTCPDFRFRRKECKHIKRYSF